MRYVVAVTETVTYMVEVDDRVDDVTGGTESAKEVAEEKIRQSVNPDWDFPVADVQREVEIVEAWSNRPRRIIRE